MKKFLRGDYFTFFQGSIIKLVYYNIKVLNLVKVLMIMSNYDHLDLSTGVDVTTMC